MNTIPRAVVLGGAILVASIAHAQSNDDPWRYFASLAYYDTPHSEDFWNPVVKADKGRLHLEARYQYVGLHTGSFLAGANVTTGKKWILNATPYLGIVVGSIEGITPGFELSLTRSWFTFSSDGQYLFDVHGRDGDFFYSWTTATGSPVDWFRVGFVGQRTNAYDTNDDIQRGLLVGFTYKDVDLEADWLDPDRDDETFVFSLTVTF